MDKIEYKGFSVTTSRVHSKDYRYYVLTEGVNPFNPKGYPTLNHAKGAITNYLKAQEAKYPEITAAVAEQGTYQNIPADVLDMAISMLPVRRKEVKPEHATQSRNKREGHFFGKGNGKFDRFGTAIRPLSVRDWIVKPVNRKQRKQAKMLGYRDSAAQ